MPKFYLTTPIYYVNARPHIGHAYTTIAADVIARRHRLLGDDTFLLTGTDEHGQKIARSAAAAGIPTQQFADQVSASFRSLWDRMGITYNEYIRTTDEKHKKGVQKLFQLLRDRGAIYLSTYTGQYSVGEEMFVDGPPGTIGTDGKPTETVTEENYFFRLSDYQLPLIDLIESNELSIQPEVRKNEVLSFLRGNTSATIPSPRPDISGAPSMSKSHLGMGGSTEPPAATEPGAPEPALSSPKGLDSETWVGAPQTPAPPTLPHSAAGNPYVPGALKDLSISRSSFKWGIPVPGDEKHVIYVWLDALANYMTAIGYGSDDPAEQANFEKYWPADLHLVGKEIIRFHCVYWPAFLLAAGLPLPKAITAHGWLLFEDSKMSKSRGNIVRTETILDAFGEHVYKKEFPDSTKQEQDLFASDVLRYFLLREIPFGQDGSFSFDALVQRYNSDLANGYGNLVSRTLSMVVQPFQGRIPDAWEGNVEANGFRKDAGTSIRAAAESLQACFSHDHLVLIERDFDRNAFNEALISVFGLIAKVDLFLASTKPWTLAKNITEYERGSSLSVVLYAAAESIRIITALLYPILPYATAKVWAQLGLIDIEASAKNGELTNLKWGDLKLGTELGPLAAVFPRIEKKEIARFIQIMTDMESGTPQPGPSKLTDEKTGHTAPAPADPTHPGAAPRTSSFAEASPGTTVGGSQSATTTRPQTPSHAEAPASGLFANSALGSAIPDTPQIAIDDFVKIDLRVAQIVLAERIPKADKLLRLEVDLGYEKRQILSGIAEWYTPEELLGRRIVVIANLAPRTMRGLQSHGMLLAASHGEDGKPILATFNEDISLGSRLR